jgi:hypothetical protein
LALIALLLQATSFSPDAGFKNDGTVGVVATGRVEVLTTVVGVVVATESEEAVQATVPKRKGRSRSAFFTPSFCQEIDGESQTFRVAHSHNGILKERCS